jgi:branched-chain amino acid transport system substrate-binding protein
MKIVTRLASFSLFFCMLFVSGCKDAPIENIEIKVDALSSLTGNWSSLGLTTKAAMELADEDINAYFASKGSRYRLVTNTYDTQLEADKAVNFFKTAAGSGTRFIIGPQSSAELGAILPLTATNNTLVISQGSTAGSLAIAGDAVFRFCPADKLEGAAVAKTIYDQGIRGLVTLARDDAGNKGLQSATTQFFTAAGGEVRSVGVYSVTETDFTTILNSVKIQLESLTTKYGAGKVGIYLASFDECVPLFKKAAADPIFSSVKWYGGDGVALSAALVGDPDAAAFAVATEFFTPTYGLSDAYKAKWEPLLARLKAKTGIDADAFGAAAYDAMWVIAKTVQASYGVPSDLTTLKNLFTAEANAYEGVTGPTKLDNFGDRATGSFDYFGIEKIGNEYQWKLVGKSN